MGHEQLQTRAMSTRHGHHIKIRLIYVGCVRPYETKDHADTRSADEKPAIQDTPTAAAEPALLPPFTESGPARICS